MPVISLNTCAFWQMLAIKVWWSFMKTARRPSRNPNTMRWQSEKNRAIGVWHGNGLWLNIYSVSWKCFVSWAKGIVIGERGLLCASIWSLPFTTLNSHQFDFCKRSNEVIAVIHDSETIQIFGLGETKGELKKRFEQEGLKTKVLAVETVDKMTERQISAKVSRTFFDVKSVRKNKTTNFSCILAGMVQSHPAGRSTLRPDYSILERA